MWEKLDLVDDQLFVLVLMGHCGQGEALDCLETLWAQMQVQGQPGPLSPEVVEPEKELKLHMLQLLKHSM